MSYKKSKHCIDFVKKMNSLIDSTDQADQSSQDIRDLVYCSAILLTSAQIEKYIENIFSSWGSYMNSKTGRAVLKNSKLPENLKNFKLLINQKNALDEYYRTKDESKYLRVVGQNPSLLKYANPTGKVTRINLSRVYAGRKYPSPKNFKVLFNRIGIASIFDSMGAKSSTNMKDVLDAFNSLRTQIAHDGKVTGLTKSDIKQYLQRMSKFIEVLDEVLYDHIHQYTGKSSWKYIKAQTSI